MNGLPEFFAGVIAREYGELSMKGSKESNPTDTCGSDCSGGDCSPDETCPMFRKKDKDKDKDKGEYKKKAFNPIVEGWNEPPAAHL
jgi:hypothetical protein